MESTFKSDEMISFHRNKYDIEPNPPDSLQLAYEDKRYEKMTSEILEAEDILKIKTLQELNADFVWADKIAFALRLSGILHALIRHLPNPVDEIRELSSRALVNVCDVMKGKQLIAENEYILNIVALVDDPLDKIRRNALDALKNYTQFTDEANECVRKDVLKKLVEKLIEEKNVDNLHKCLQVIRQLLEAEDGIFKILLTAAITRLKFLLRHDEAKIRSQAAYDLTAISFKNEGKEMIVREGCVISLCELMTDSDQLVIENATVALVSLAQLKSAKVEIIKTGHHQTVTTLLDNPAIEIRLNAVQLIGGVTEEPAGRKFYLNWVEKLREMLKDPENEFIKEYIQNTLDTILWKP